MLTRCFPQTPQITYREKKHLILEDFPAQTNTVSAGSVCLETPLLPSSFLCYVVWVEAAIIGCDMLVRSEVKASGQEQQHQQAAASSHLTTCSCRKQHEIAALRPSRHLFLLFYSTAKTKNPSRKQLLTVLC